MTTAVQLKSHSELSHRLSTAKNPLIIVEFFDTSNGRCALVSSRLQTKISCSDVKIELFRIDVLICPELAAYYKINSLPTIVAFHRSRLLTRLEGFVDDKQLDNLIDLLVNRSVI